MMRYVPRSSDLNNNVSLRANSPGALVAGRENEGELATTSLEFESPLNSPVVHLGLSCLKMSANQREAETRANVNNH